MVTVLSKLPSICHFILSDGATENAEATSTAEVANSQT